MYTMKSVFLTGALFIQAFLMCVKKEQPGNMEHLQTILSYAISTIHVRRNYVGQKRHYASASVREMKYIS